MGAESLTPIELYETRSSDAAPEPFTRIAAAKAIVKAIFGVSPEDLMKDADFTGERTRLADTLAALKFVGRLISDAQVLGIAYIAAALISALATRWLIPRAAF